MARQGANKEQGQPDEGRSDRHEKARGLAEDALGELAKGREGEADRLIEEAKELDESAVVADAMRNVGPAPDP